MNTPEAEATREAESELNVLLRRETLRRELAAVAAERETVADQVVAGTLPASALTAVRDRHRSLEDQLADVELLHRAAVARAAATLVREYEQTVDMVETDCSGIVVLAALYDDHVSAGAAMQRHLLAKIEEAFARLRTAALHRGGRNFAEQVVSGAEVRGVEDAIADRLRDLGSVGHRNLSPEARTRSVSHPTLDGFVRDMTSHAVTIARQPVPGTRRVPDDAHDE